jgi:16S rRNA (guanine966-N2)-methyltransferase
MAANEVRIISGNWKGRKLRFPDAPNLRPTLGRVRETLFNWLMGRIDGSRCLDLFAGSGALGFEALSRGAAQVTLVESNGRTAQALRDNARALGASASQCEIVCMPATRFLRQPRAPWEIIFLDPPFQDAALDSTLALILKGRLLAPAGVIYFEIPRRTPAAFDDWVLVKEGTAGDTRFGLLSHRCAEPAAAPCHA